MRLVKKPVSIAAANAARLKAQRRKEDAEKKRLSVAKSVTSKLCMQLLQMKSLKVMQNFVDTFLDSRADTICDAILEAKTFEAARKFLTDFKRELKVITVQHCYDYTTGVRRHVFRIKEMGMIPRHEVVSNDFLDGLAKLESRLTKKSGGLLSGNYIMQERLPWAPYHEIPPAVAQGMLRKQQREEGAAWTMLREQSKTLH